MPLMIDADPLKPCLLALDIAGDAIRNALDVMITAEDDLHDDAVALAAQAQQVYIDALKDLAFGVRTLVEAAESRPD